MQDVSIRANRRWRCGTRSGSGRSRRRWRMMTLNADWPARPRRGCTILSPRRPGGATLPTLSLPASLVSAPVKNWLTLLAVGGTNYPKIWGQKPCLSCMMHLNTPTVQDPRRSPPLTVNRKKRVRTSQSSPLHNARVRHRSSTVSRKPMAPSAKHATGPFPCLRSSSYWQQLSCAGDCRGPDRKPQFRRMVRPPVAQRCFSVASW